MKKLIIEAHGETEIDALAAALRVAASAINHDEKSGEFFVGGGSGFASAKFIRPRRRKIPAPKNG